MAIASVKAPENVFKGDVASVAVVVKVDGIPGVEVPVTLERPGSPPLKQVVRGQPDGSRPVVTFRVPMNTLGSHDLAIVAGPLIGDVCSDNDRRTITIQVTDDKAKVLLVDGEARWEFRYLRNALLRDPRVAVETLVFRQPKSEGGVTPSYKKALPAKPKPGEADPLGAFDAIFVGDVEPAIMPADAWSRLEAYVSGRGGTLVIIPGPRGWPKSNLSIESVVKLLPVLDPKPVLFDPTRFDPTHPGLSEGVAIAPSPAISADSWPMLQYAAAERNSAVWSSLPRLPWVLAGRAKPGATALATTIRSRSDSANDGVVIAAQSYGLGKVLWVGTDATWRWRYRAGDTYHHRFWGQVVRWAASGKLAAGNSLVRFGPDRPKVPEGESVRLQARFADGVPGVGPELLAVARVFKTVVQKGGAPKPGGDALAVIPLQSVPGQPRTFAANASALPAGRYVIRLDVPELAASVKADGMGSAPEATLEIVPSTTSELVELSASRDPLDRLAAATGGRVFTPEEAGQIPPLLRGRAIVKTRTEEMTLWDRPWSLGVFFAVLTLEWVLRKPRRFAMISERE